MAIRYAENGYRDYYPRTTNKITPTITTQATSTVEGRAADGSILPGWFESYCVAGSSVRKILANGYSTCPMYYRGVTETVQEKAMRELMETLTPVSEPERVAWTYPYTAEEKLQMQQQTAQIQVCPPTCPDGYSAPGVLLPGWIQPQCIRAPCPAMYVGDKGDLITEIFEMPAQNGTTVVVATDDAGDVIGAVEKKPNWLPLALAAGAAYFFMM